MSDIVSRRLRAQRLAGDHCPTAADVVRWLGAVQAQDYPAAKWSVAQRTRTETDDAVEQLFNAGEILRTHVMRPTWHFVAPEDIRWLVELTGPRLRAGSKGRHRQLELDEPTIVSAQRVFTDALSRERYMSRRALGEELQRAGISPAGQRLPHLLATGEVDGLLVSGPRIGKDLTYALLDDRVPATTKRDRDESLRELAVRYFTSHGPAQLGDFTWWSGLTVADARKGISLAGETLEEEVIDAKQYWSRRAPHAALPGVDRRTDDDGPNAHLLANFDEYTVAYRDRTALLPSEPVDLSLFPFGAIFSNVVMVDGVVAGSWRRTRSRTGTNVEVSLVRNLRRKEAAAVERAADRLARYLATPVELTWATMK